MADLLRDNDVEISGLLLGTQPHLVKAIRGWEDSPTWNVADVPRGGVARPADRQVAVVVGVRADSGYEAAVSVLRRTVTGPGLIRVRTRGVTRRALFTPSTRPLTTPGDNADLAFNHLDATLTLDIADPVLYGDSATETSFGTVGAGSPVTRTITNAGDVTAEAGRSGLGALWWEIIGGPDGCEGPWVRHMAHDGEMWWLTEAVAATGQPGSTVTVGPDRVTRRGGVLRSAQVRGPGGAPVAGWPALRPGDNAIAMGCLSGSFTARLWNRSTW